MRSVAVLAVLSALTLSAQEVPGPLPRVDSLLVLDAVSTGGRSPVFTDPVERLLVEGAWRAPEPGGAIQVAGGPARSWRTIAANPDGWFGDPALRGGYAFVRIDWPAEEVLLLEAQGHRHVYLNGTPRVGDVYGLGWVSIPILFRKGGNELLFRAGRGRLKIGFSRPPAPVFFGERDLTLPQALHGEKGPWWAGIPVVNATGRWQHGLAARVGGPSGPLVRLPAIAPLTLRKAAIPLALEAREGEKRARLGLELLDPGGALLHAREIELDACSAHGTHKRTFSSAIDGSVQYYAVTPPEQGAPDRLALFLALHGASVEALGLARCFEPKATGVVVAPTNRRPFGFDWEDWGRLDALEVLAEARALYPIDPGRIYLTGHSMGGHGTWHLGVHYPGLFAAIAPSAGWRDFWSYGGAVDWPGAGPIEELLSRAMSGSRTLLLESNLEHMGVYILHGDKDTNVPVAQARFMRGRLGAFHPNWCYYERPGAEHWWGNACVDWPPLFRFLLDNERPSPAGRVRFACVHPGISARLSWVAIRSQERPFAVSSVDAALAADRIAIRTENVAVLGLDLGSGELPALPGGPLAVEIDGQRVLEALDSQPPGEILFERVAGAWRRWAPPAEEGPAEKSPERAGPFKDVFRRRMLLVFGTGGEAEERSWALAKAVYDAETFWYRGNGSVEVLADTDYDPHRFPDRNVILYGNAKTNAAWEKALDPACPISVQAGHLRVGEREFSGEDLACLFVYPHRERTWSETLVGVVAGTGPAGMRLTNQLPYFVSGVAYPDWTVLGVEMLQDGVKGVRGAGFFDRRWRLADPAFR